MDKVAFIFGSLTLYWHGIFVALGVLGAVVLCYMLVKLQGDAPQSVIATAALAAPLCLLLSRLCYWYFNQEQFSGAAAALLGEGKGGYSLPGLFLSLVLSVLIMKKLGVIPSAKRFFDALAPALSLGIAVGRLSGFFSEDDKGNVVTDPNVQRFPWAFYSEKQEAWLFSTFLFEAAAGAVIVIILLGAFLRIYCRQENAHERSDCNVALLFLSLFGITQGVLESTRSDSVFMNTVAFVRVVQIMSLLFIIFCFVVYSVRSVKKNTLLPIHFALWIFSAAMLALAVVMEFKMAASVMLTNYSVMANCLLFIFFVTLLLRQSCYSDFLKATVKSTNA